MNIRKLIATATVAVLAGGGLALATALPASATYTETCIPAEAYTEVVVEGSAAVPGVDGKDAVYETVVVSEAGFQRYSWTGGPTGDTAPAFPSADWQANVAGDPHGIGVAGAYFQSHGNSGKGDWFYLEAVEAVTEERLVSEAVAPVEAIPAVERVVIEHPAVTCPPAEEEPPVVTNQCVDAVGTHSTNLNDLWGNVDTRSAGHVEYVENGLHIWTDDNSSNAKVSEGIAVNFALKNTGVLDLGWTGSTPPPGINLFVNFGTDGNGTLVYESVYGQDLWLTNGSSAAVKANAPVNGGGNGSQFHGTIDQWLTKYPDAQVVGLAYSLGSGVKGDGVISSITAGCATHTFDFEEEPVIVPEQPEPTVTVETAEVVDCETSTVEITTTTTTTTTVYDEESNTWIAGDPIVEVVVTERAATAEECPVVVPPVDPEEPVTPVDEPIVDEPLGQGGDDGQYVATEALAQTGSTLPIAAGVLAILAIAAGTGALVLRRRQHAAE